MRRKLYVLRIRPSAVDFFQLRATAVANLTVKSYKKLMGCYIRYKSYLGAEKKTTEPI